jgi:hypothetical protein
MSWATQKAGITTTITTGEPERFNIKPTISIATARTMLRIVTGERVNHQHHSEYS